MKTNGDILRARAEQQGIPLRSLANVRADLAHAKTLEAGTDIAMASPDAAPWPID